MEIFWNETTPEQWEGLADRACAPLQQRWNYGAVHKALGGQVQRALITRHGRPAAICQCLSRVVAGVLKVSLATRGPVWLSQCDQNHTLALIRRSLPLPRPRVQLFTLPDAQRSARLIPLMTPATTTLRSLPVALPELHGKWRNALKKAEKSGLQVQHGRCNVAELHGFLERDAAQQAARSYRALPAAFTRKWQSLDPEGLQLFRALENGKTVARALFLRHGNSASYHLAETSQRGRETAAQRLLLWRAFGYFTRQGLRQVDLGQIDTENAPGLARFKLGTGARACRMGPTVLAL